MANMPKRSDQRHGHRTAAERSRTVKAPGAAEVPIPAADTDWHPLMRDWYDSLALSGQAVFYEPSDWAQARVIAQAVSDQLKSPKGLTAFMLGQFTSASNQLLVTEGSRRQLHLELQRAGAEDADEVAAVTQMAAYREQLA